MADCFDKGTRSRIMRAIKSKNTGPERRLRSALRSAGVRFDKSPGSLPCKVDIWIPHVRIAIFVDGDYWHRCPLHSKTTSNEGWRRKLAANIERDRRDEERLLALNILPVRVWECEILRRADTVAEEVRTLVGAFAAGTVSVASLSWAAGILDGEGSITLMSGGKQQAPHVQVGMKHKHVLERLAMVFGVGVVSHWSRTRPSMHKLKLQGGRQVMAVCRAVKCLLHLKRPQAELLCLFCSTLQVGTGRTPVPAVSVRERAEILAAVRSLNRRALNDSEWRANLSAAATRSWELRRIAEPA